MGLKMTNCKLNQKVNGRTDDEFRNLEDENFNFYRFFEYAFLILQ